VIVLRHRVQPRVSWPPPPAGSPGPSHHDDGHPVRDPLRSRGTFFLLQPLTGLGNLTAIIALVTYTLLIIFRNVTDGLRNVPADIVDAARGQGLTQRQILRQVELPLAVPEIFAGLRIAFSTTVGLATLAVFAGGGGLGTEILTDRFFQSNVVVAGGLAVLLAAAFDLVLLAVQRLVTPWMRVGTA
jgi:osmoprotectant transport system permease protein